MTSIQPHFTKFYNFPEFESLRQGKNFCSRHIDFTPSVGTVDYTPPLPIDISHCIELGKIADPSLVGKGSTTVIDTNIRQSREILPHLITLTPDFTRLIDNQIAALAEELDHPYTVQAKFHKLIIYQTGDEFKTHIDSIHIPNMIMTLSVILPGKIQGGELVIDDQPISTSDKQFTLALFYNDVPHEVKYIHYGYRLVLIFDVITTDVPIPHLLTQYNQSFEAGWQKLLEQGVNKVGILVRYTYIGDNISFSHLKGKDRIFYEFIKDRVRNLQLVPLASEDSSWFHKEIVDVYKTFSTFSTLYDTEGGEKYTNKYLTKTYDKYTDIKPVLGNLTLTCLRPEAILGDVVFLQTGGRYKQIFQGNSEIHLGNSGFYGTINETLGLIAYL